MSVPMKNATSDAREMAAPAGELKKKTITGGATIPNAPLSRPATPPVASVSGPLGIVLRAYPLRNSRTAPAMAIANAIFDGATGTAARNQTPSGVPTRHPSHRSLSDRQSISFQIDGSKDTEAAISIMNTGGMTMAGGRTSDIDEIASSEKPKPL